MRRTILLLGSLIILMVPFLNACDVGDADILINYVKLWAMVHDITDADGSVNYGGATRFIVGEAGGFGSTGDKESDAVIDSARTIKKMREAQSEANLGWKEMYDGRNVKISVLPHYNQAVKLRPNDWVYYNERGISYLLNWDNSNYLKDARTDFKKAEEVTNGKPSEIFKLFGHRADSLQKLVKHDIDTNVAVPYVLYAEQSRTYAQLAGLTSDSQYTRLKQEADDHLKTLQRDDPGMYAKITAN